jgi:HTH-type transcriptional regulator / antitoxin HipB
MQFITAKPVMTSLPQLIKSHRKKAALTQAQLATLAGIGKTVVWDIENGKESVQWDTLQKILRVLNISVEWRSPLLDRIASLEPTPVFSPHTSSSLSKPPVSENSAANSPTE